MIYPRLQFRFFENSEITNRIIKPKHDDTSDFSYKEKIITTEEFDLLIHKHKKKLTIFVYRKIVNKHQLEEFGFRFNDLKF